MIRNRTLMNLNRHHIMNVTKCSRHYDLHSIRFISILPSNNSTTSPPTNPSPSSHKHHTKRSPPPPPRPPHTKHLPTLDVSPILDPTLYLKKYSKSTHKKCGSEASQRLLKAQNKIRDWIWDVEKNNCHYRNESNVDNNSNNNNDFDGDERRRRRLTFRLIGHGVPYQLFQDHVDVAWGLMEQQSTYSKHNDNNDGGSQGNVGGKREVVECIFANDTNGDLKLDCMNIRNRDGYNYTIPYPLQYNDNDQINNNHGNSKNKKVLLEDIHHSVDLYLTVMNRLSRTFGTILQTVPSPSSLSITEDTTTTSSNSSTSTSLSSSATASKYWKNDKTIPILNWKTTIKRGFEYPPSATTVFVNLFEDDSSSTSSSFSNRSNSSDKSPSSNDDDNDEVSMSTKSSNNNNGNIVNDKNDISKPKQQQQQNMYGKSIKSGYYGEWTNPPIIELIDTTSTNNVKSSVKTDDSITEVSEFGNHTKGPSFVRVTIQGIPSFFWKHHTSNTKHGTSSTITSTSAASTEEDCENQIKTTTKSGGNMTDGERGNNDRDDMVPISLIFEACFHDEGGQRQQV